MDTARKLRAVLAAFGPLLLALPAATPAAAQSTLTGIVLDQASGRPLSSVEVAIEALGKTTRTDSTGRYTLPDLSAGTHTVRVRLVGYKPLTFTVQLVEGETHRTNFMLDRAPVRLDSVVVVARSERLREFEDDRRLGLGHTWTGAELEAQHVQRVAEAFDRVASARVLRGHGNAAWVYNSRPGRPARNPDLGDFIRGAQRACYANVFLDGVQVYHGRDGEPLFDLNELRVDEIEGIEYYAGPAETPARYSSLDMSCGVIVIWTKR